VAAAPIPLASGVVGSLAPTEPGLPRAAFRDGERGERQGRAEHASEVRIDADNEDGALEFPKGVWKTLYFGPVEAIEPCANRHRLISPG
jgi:hypothetical protein